MEEKKLYFKSDFKLFETCSAGYTVPFRFYYYTNARSRAFVASYDGTTYENCKVMDDGRLCVAFDDHKLGLGSLMVERRYYLTDEDFASGICDQVITPTAVVYVDDDEAATEYYITLALEGDDTLTASCTVPANYQKGDKGDPGLSDEEREEVLSAIDKVDELELKVGEIDTILATLNGDEA